MVKKGFLESIHVPAPCDASWEDMLGDDRKRFCLGCQKDVYNLAAMSRRDATYFILKNEGKVCIRYGRTADGSVVTTERKLHNITRSRTVVAAGVIAASLTLATAAYSQGEPVTPKKEGNVENSSGVTSQSKTSQISFTIYDASRSVITLATVILTSEKSKQVTTVLTDQNGRAQFDALPRGRYAVKTFARGFQSKSSTIVIEAPVESNIDITLEVGGVGGFITIGSDSLLFEAIRQDDNEAVKNLINSGFKIETKDSHRRTALHVAVEHENYEIVRFLLDRGANVNAKTTNKRTVIWMINDYEKKSSLDLLRLLLSKGADVNVPNDEKETLLIVASDDDNLEVVKILLGAGANPNLKDDDGETAIQKTSSDEIRQLLIKHGAKQPK